MRSLLPFGFGVAGLLAASVAGAAPSALIAASDPASVNELELARVAFNPSPFWLRARAAPQTKIAVVSGADGTDPAPNAAAWLGALDFATRVRVTPPLGPLAACSDATGKLADSGAPEPAVIEPSQISTVSTEVDLRRSLADAGLSVDASEIAAFTANVAAPYRITWFESGERGGDTAAIRVSVTTSGLSVPGVVFAARSSVPATVLALASTGLEPSSGNAFEPTDFAVAYSGADAQTNYTSARAAWLAEDPSRWLTEARASTALFDYTVVAGVGQIEPGASQYFERALGITPGRACFGSVLAAHARGSRSDTDFECGGADDLKLAEIPLDFAEPLVTRLFGSLTSDELALRVSSQPAHDSHVVATDFDATNCTPAASGMTGVVGVVSGGQGASSSSSSSSSSTDGSYANGSGSIDSSGDDSSVDSSDDNCGVTVYPDSCSGDSSSSSSSDDSCSGDSSSSDSSSDSCSGDSSSSDDDSSGCGPSGSKGDTCGGSSESSASVDQTSAGLSAPGQSTKSHRPRKLHLSLLTLCSAALAFTLRRRGARFHGGP